MRVNEIVAGVDIALGRNEVSSCPAMDCEDGSPLFLPPLAPIACLTAAVTNALADACAHVVVTP